MRVVSSTPMNRSGGATTLFRLTMTSLISLSTPCSATPGLATVGRAAGTWATCLTSSGNPRGMTSGVISPASSTPMMSNCDSTE